MRRPALMLLLLLLLVMLIHLLTASNLLRIHRIPLLLSSLLLTLSS
jgi:hypothetical protein